MHVYIGFDVLTMETMKSMDFWVVKPRGSDRAQHFGGTYRLHLQGQIIRKARNQQKRKASVLFVSYWLLGVVI
jgi:hypothetical protein